MKVLIIEDEAHSANSLKKLLGEIEPDCEIAGILPSMKAVTQWFAENPQPDLVLMDIQLSDGVSFDLFKTVSIQCPVIFTTAYNEYALRAFKVNSIDYLLKPIEGTELTAALDKYHRLHRYQQAGEWQARLEDFMKDIRPGAERKKFKERFLVHARNRIIPVSADAVAYFCKEEIIFLVTHDNQRHVSDFDTLEEVEQVVDPTLFFRANRQYVIQIHSIDSIRPHATGKLTVKLKSPLSLEVDVSREKAHMFKEWLG